MSDETIAPGPASTAPAPDLPPAGTETSPAKPAAPTWTALAGKLGVSVQAVTAWRARPDAPRDPHLPTWRKYVKANHLGAQKKGVSDDLRSKKIEAEIEFMRARTARAKRETITLAELNEMHLDLATQVRAELYHWMESALPPKLEGLTAAEIRPLLREAADAICDRLADKLKRFEEEQ